MDFNLLRLVFDTAALRAGDSEFGAKLSLQFLRQRCLIKAWNGAVNNWPAFRLALQAGLML